MKMNEQTLYSLFLLTYGGHASDKSEQDRALEEISRRLETAPVDSSVNPAYIWLLNVVLQGHRGWEFQESLRGLLPILPEFRGWTVDAEMLPMARLTD